jgi:hypothetical protein
LVDELARRGEEEVGGAEVEDGDGADEGVGGQPAHLCSLGEWFGWLVGSMDVVNWSSVVLSSRSWDFCGGGP